MSTPPPVAEAEVAPPLRRTSTDGFVYTFGRAVFVRGLSLITFAILGRLLEPRDYGLIALANVFLQLLGILAAAGYSQVLVQLPKVEHEDLDTIFWISLGTSLVLTLIMCIAAWPIADAYHEPELRPVLQVLSTSFIFIALGSTHQAMLQRKLEFRLLARAAVVANVVATAVGIAFAFGGLGVWSLVVQWLLGVGVQALIFMAMSGYRPRLYVSIARFRPMFEFSRNYMGSTLLTFFSQRTADFLIGSGLGATALGIYSVAFRILSIMLDVLSSTVRQVAFPVFSRLQGDKARLLRGYISATTACATVTVPAFLFGVAAAPELIRIVFGSKWEAAIPIEQILCLFGALQAIQQFNTTVLQSVGKVNVIFRLGVLGTVLQVVAFLITVPYGLEWVAAAYVARAYLIAPIGFVIAARALGTTTRKTLAGIVAPCISSGVMVVAMFATRKLLPDVPDIVRLMALVVVSLVVYLSVLRTIGRDAFEETWSYARDLWEQRRARRQVSPAAPL